MASKNVKKKRHQKINITLNIKRAIFVQTKAFNKHPEIVNVVNLTAFNSVTTNK